MPIKGISLKNITIQAKSDAVFYNSQDIRKENVNITVVK